MSSNPKRTNALLWSAQIILALAFLFAGGMKLIMPLAAMQQGPMALPGSFLRSLGVVEILGALGLVLPGLLHIRTDLTPLAAAGLVIIMVGATVITAISMGVLPALMPLVVGVLAVVVCVGRGGIRLGHSGHSLRPSARYR